MSDKVRTLLGGFILGAFIGVVLTAFIFALDRQYAVVCIEYDATTETCLKTMDRDNLNVDNLKQMYQK